MPKVDLIRSRRLLLASIAAACLVGAAEHSAPPKPKTAKAGAPLSPHGNADAITEDELKIYLYFLASDQLEGRNLPSRGYDTAALYVASHLAEWGLKSGGSSTNTVGPLQPYFMPMALLAKTIIPDETKAKVTLPGRGRRDANSGGASDESSDSPAATRTVEFEYGKDWTMNPGRGAAPLEPGELSGNVVFAGNGYTIEKTKTDPYAGLDVKGKIVVVAGLPPEITAQQAAARARGDETGGGRGANPFGEACVDYMTPEQAAAKNGAVAVLTLASFQDLSRAGQGGGRGAGNFNGPAYRVPKLSSNAACLAVPAATIQLSMANAIFEG
jgi:hypothetical protein